MWMLGCLSTVYLIILGLHFWVESLAQFINLYIYQDSNYYFSYELILHLKFEPSYILALFLIEMPVGLGIQNASFSASMDSGSDIPPDFC